MVDESVIKKCQKGKKDAQRVLYLAYAKKMFMLSYRYVNHKENAEEIVSEGFLKVLLNIHKIEFRNVPLFEAWMRKIIVNECLTFLRKKRQLFVEESEFESISNNTEAEIQLETQHLLEMVLSLPIGYRTVFNMYAIEGYTHKEISEKLNIAESTSRSQLTKARNILRKKYRKYNHDR